MRLARPALIPALLAASAVLAVQSVSAAPARTTAQQQAEALDIWKKMIAIPTVQGRGQMPVMARYVADLLVKNGFAADDIKIEGSGDGTSLSARYRGTGKGEPILLSGHMDVVEAMPSDWTRDPFTPIEEGGFVYGRGSTDMKFGNAVMVSTLIALKREGFRPSRDIVLLLSGDEETEMASTQRLAAGHAEGAELLLNADAGGGLLDEQGKPVAYMLQMGEKTYADYQISFTDAGGHSSRPGPNNPIYRLSKAIDRLAAFQFPAQVSELTRGYFRATGKQVGGDLGAAMLKFADDPNDAAAVAKLRADPEYIGQTGTTCVATMLSGGHALNALPQKASLSVNCRIFPGVSVESVRDTLAKVVADPEAKLTILGAPVASDASPARPDVMKAARKAVDLVYPGLPIVPQMSVGATDSLYFRAKGLPSYGVSGMFMKPEDDFAHGLNERTPVATLAPALTMWRSLLTDLAK